MKNMIKMRPYAPSDRIAIRADSIDEEISDDIEDDVFIRDGRSTKMNEENCMKRPLMAPRRTTNYNHNNSHHQHPHLNNNNHNLKNNKNKKLQNPISIMKKNRHRHHCWKCCEPFCYGLAALTILIVIIFLAALILTLFPIPLQKLKIWFKNDYTNNYEFNNRYEEQSNSMNNKLNLELIPCTQITVHKVWMKIFPRLNSESPIRNADLNGDGILDVIFGYGIDDSIEYENLQLPKCISARQDKELQCEGGVIALNGLNGDLIWQRWTIGNIFSILCTLDINMDGYMDCIAAGRGGIVIAINGRNGEIIWNLRELDAETNSPIIIDLYTINIVRDLNEDNCPDILAVHLEERQQSRNSHIKLISGINGQIIRSIPTPYKEEIFVPLQIIVQSDGTELLLILTGGQNSPGGIYIIRLLTLMEYRNEHEFNIIYKNVNSGFMVPAILTDITNDGIDDIIISSFNSTIYAFNGINYTLIWNYTLILSESVSSIVPGYFNHDNILDFMIKYNTGPGFPIYYYSQTTIINGINGQPLLKQTMLDSGGPNSLLGGISISQTFGGDFFLHWQLQCRNQYNTKDPYEFIPDSDVILQARADVCLLRYNTTTVLKLYAIARHVEPPGAVIFNSDDIGVHLNQTQTEQILINKQFKNSVSPLKHPKMLKKLQSNLHNENTNTNNNNIPTLTNINNDELLTSNIPLRKTYMKIRNKQPLRLDILTDSREQFNHKPLIYDPKMIKLPIENTNTNDDGDEDENRGGEFEQPILHQKPQFPYSTFNELLPPPPERIFQKDYENESPRLQPDEYDTYNDEQLLPQQQQQQQQRPIRLRTKYPGNRDVRSDLLNEFNTESNDVDYIINNLTTIQSNENNNTNSSIQHNSELTDASSAASAASAVNLWDLEIEKEELEAHQIANKLVDYNERQRRDSIIETTTETPPLSSSSTNDNNENDLFLASISSTGILMASLDKSSNSSLDFTFVVNVRESETYPPLFLKSDLKCIEEKMSTYKNFVNEDQITFQKRILNKCLKARIGNILPNQPRHESQIVITRISITCTCNNLQPGEICSNFNSIDKQKWTQFMGNSGNGFYGN